MPRPQYRDPTALLQGLTESLRSAVLASADMDPLVADMSPEQVEQAYVELDGLRSRVQEAIEAVMVRRRVRAAAAAIERELQHATADEARQLRAAMDEHAELLATLR